MSQPVLLGQNLTTALRRFIVTTRCVLDRNGPGIVLYRQNVHDFSACAHGILSLKTIITLGRLARLPIVISPDRTTNGHRLIPGLTETTITSKTSNLVVRYRPIPRTSISSTQRTLSLRSVISLIRDLQPVTTTINQRILTPRS